MDKWYMGSGCEDDVCVSSRIRLARNLKNYPFPPKMTLDQRKTVNTIVWDAVQKGGFDGSLKLRLIEMDQVSDIEAYSMVERHIISPNFAKYREGRGLILSYDESVSIMLGEEDHIRIQVIKPGLELHEAYHIADRLDTLIGESIDVAFDSRLGYLTECPTNLGTGLRASVMLHLPALTATSAIGRLSSSVGKLGLTVRGMYGEGSNGSNACLYQLSNQVTLGLSEESAISNLKSIAGQLIAQEKAARGQWSRVYMEDKAWRALGLLRTARILSSDELLGLLSAVRLGVSLGLIPDIRPAALTTLLFEAGANTIQLKGEMNEDDRDVFRANLVRQRLA